MQAKTKKYKFNVGTRLICKYDRNVGTVTIRQPAAVRIFHWGFALSITVLGGPRDLMLNWMSAD